MKEAQKEPDLVKDSRDISFQCVDAVEISLFIEKEGLAFYEKAAKNALDLRVKDMFLRLAEEERIHIQTLKNKIQFFHFRKFSIFPNKSNLFSKTNSKQIHVSKKPVLSRNGKRGKCKRRNTRTTRREKLR